MKDKYDTISEDIKNKIEKIQSPSLKAKLIELNTITNILLYDKEDKFHNEYKQIRGNCEIKSFNIYKKISDIIQGKINPTDLLTEEDYIKYKINKEENQKESEININYKEIKDFWLIALKNCDYFYISNFEEKILHYLKDIKIELHDNKIDLTLYYFFEQNEYFKNDVIKKHYFYNSNNEKLERSEFDDIFWNKNISDKIKENKNKKNFFDMFNKDKVTKELDENEANFLKNDFMPGVLEYYMNLVKHKKTKDDFDDNILGTFNAGKINIKTIK